jgi:hypothetical protein
VIPRNFGDALGHAQKGRVIAVQFDAMGCGLRQAALPTDVQPPVIAA